MIQEGITRLLKNIELNVLETVYTSTKGTWSLYTAHKVLLVQFIKMRNADWPIEDNQLYDNDLVLNPITWIFLCVCDFTILK